MFMGLITTDIRAHKNHDALMQDCKFFYTRFFYSMLIFSRKIYASFTVIEHTKDGGHKNMYIVHAFSNSNLDPCFMSSMVCNFAF